MTSCDNRHLHQDVDIVDDPGVDHHDSNENQYLFVFHHPSPFLHTHPALSPENHKIIMKIKSQGTPPAVSFVSSPRLVVILLRLITCPVVAKTNLDIALTLIALF